MLLNFRTFGLAIYNKFPASHQTVQIQPGTHIHVNQLTRTGRFLKSWRILCSDNETRTSHQSTGKCVFWAGGGIPTCEDGHSKCHSTSIQNGCPNPS
jgi:hypothetical protein